MRLLQHFCEVTFQIVRFRNIALHHLSDVRTEVVWSSNFPCHEYVSSSSSPPQTFIRFTCSLLYFVHVLLDFFQEFSCRSFLFYVFAELLQSSPESGSGTVINSGVFSHTFRYGMYFGFSFLNFLATFDLVFFLFVHDFTQYFHVVGDLFSFCLIFRTFPLVL